MRLGIILSAGYTKMRFLKQKDRFRCGPVALVNALKWSGKKSTSKDLIKISHLLKTKPKTGTYIHNIEKVVDKFFKNSMLEAPCLRTLDNHLAANGAILFSYAHPEKRKGHIFLIIKNTDKTYLAVNFSNKKTISIVCKTTIKSMVDKYRSFAWLINK